MKAYKIEILVIDFDEIGANDIKSELENANYPNDCITPEVKKITAVDIGEWSDDHPLNNNKTAEDEYRKLFS